MNNANTLAFPTPAVPFPDGSFDPSVPGLTKREYFAAMAMQGALANAAYFQACQERPGLWSEYVATASVRAADALLAELAKQ